MATYAISSCRGYKCIAAVTTVSLLIPACDTSSSPPPSQTTKSPTEIRASAGVPERKQDREIDALIDQLAIPGEGARVGQIDPANPEWPTAEEEKVARDAATKLRTLGKAAFTRLAAYVHDERESVEAFRAVNRSTVGIAAVCIIESAIYQLPNDYRRSLYRTGADGESHARPLFLAPGIFTADTIDEWLSSREDKSLMQIQIEALDWLIAEEKKIGFQTEKDRDDYLHPLEKQLGELRTMRESK